MILLFLMTASEDLLLAQTSLNLCVLTVKKRGHDTFTYFVLHGALDWWLERQKVAKGSNPTAACC